MSDYFPYDFGIQKKLFEIAINIINDYGAKEWSFGGGTALSVCYWQHRMSYDIDIFTEDRLFIETLLECKKQIADSLEIPLSNVQYSEKNITFIIGSKEKGNDLKLDFLYTIPLLKEPYVTKNIFDQNNIKVQTAHEIIAKKLLRREYMTVRDFVDFARYSKENSLKTVFVSAVSNNDFLKEQGFNPIERLLTIKEHFESIEIDEFIEELAHLRPWVNLSPQDMGEQIKSLVCFEDIIQLAIHKQEIVSFDEYIDFYKEAFEQIGNYDTFVASKKALCNHYGIDCEVLDYKFLLGKFIDDKFFINSDEKVKFIQIDDQIRFKKIDKIGTIVGTLEIEDSGNADK